MSISGGVRPEWLTHELFPCRSRFAEIDGHLVHYVDEGGGPPLLMLHGNPTWSFVYRHLIRLLRDRFRCVAVDYPGFGLSVAAEAYDHLPESHMAVRFSRMMGGPIGGFAIRNFNAFVNVMIPLGTPRRKLSSEVMRAYRRPLGTRDRRKATHVFPKAIVGSTPFLSAVRDRLRALADKPVLLCWGDKDIAFREEERARFAQLLTRSRVVALHGSGHYVQEESPAEIAAAIRTWWSDDVEGRP